MTASSPFVYWAQNEANVFLKVDLTDAENVNVDLAKRSLHFAAKGAGAQGFKDYQFDLDFHSEINVNESIYKITGKGVNLTICKENKEWWPRLISKPQKPVWLKIDFDKWQSEEDLNEDLRDILEDYPSLYDNLQKQEMGYRKEDFKKVYLTLYNLFMYVAFMYIVCILCIKYVKDGSNCFVNIYESVGPVMCFLQLLQYLEVMHPLFGYTKGGILMPFLQVTGRSIVLFFMVEFEPRIQKMPVVFYMLLTWSAIEIIRYPYYMSQLHKKENGLLTWLRYSVWMVLYPIGFFCEGVIIFRNLIFSEQSNKWSISLPNKYNFTFHFPSVIRMYLLFGMIPAFYTLMTHMHKIRQQKIGPKKPRIKFRRN